MLFSRADYHPLSPIRLLPLLPALFLSGCFDPSNNVEKPSSPATYKIGGVVWGLNADGLVLQNNDSDDLSVAGNAFEFATALAGGSVYDVTVLSQPTAQNCTVNNGNGVIADHDVTDVAVTCMGWNNPIPIETHSGGDATVPQIATDGNGNALAVWEQFDGTWSSIWANRYTLGSGWGSAKLISTTTALASNPQIAIDRAGNAMAVWNQSSDTWANRYTAGSGWGSAELIETDAGYISAPQIAVDDNGNAIAVWTQQDGIRMSVFSNLYTAGSGWGTAELIETDNSGNANSPQIVFDADGNALTVWAQFDGDKTSIFANRYTKGSGWGSAELIETDDLGNGAGPQIAIDSAGNALVVWMHGDDTRWNIQANRYTVGRGWGSAELIETNNLGDASDPQIAVDANGNALAVWEQSDGIVYSIWANRYTVGSGWASAVLIELGTGSAGLPQVAIDSNGNALAVWEQSDGSWISIWANRYTSGTGWANAVLVETGNTGSAVFPQITIDGNGNALAVWQQRDGIQYNIWANRYDY